MSIQSPLEKLHTMTSYDRNAPPVDPRVDDLMKEYIEELRLFLPKDNFRNRVPGAAVMVRHRCELVHMGCYGYADIEAGRKITSDTIFDLGSVSKQFTAVAVHGLALKNLLKLTDPISKFFPDFPRYADNVTINDLLSHTSALPEYTDLYVAQRFAEDDWYKEVMKTPDDWYPRMSKKQQKELTNEEVIQWIASQKLLPRAPNTEFEYSNAGYVVLAEIVKRVSGMPLSRLLKENVFSEYGMESTYVLDDLCDFDENAPEVINHAKCYNRRRDTAKGESGYFPVGYTPLNFIHGDGNVQSTIEDMTRWEAELAKAEYQSLTESYEADDRLVAVRDALWLPTELKNHRRVNYGAGWNLLREKDKEESEDENGNMVVKTILSNAEYHRGVWLGWRSYIVRASKIACHGENSTWDKQAYSLEPSGSGQEEVDANSWESLGIIVLSNNNRFNACEIAQKISQFYWGKLKKDNILNRFDC